MPLLLKGCFILIFNSMSFFFLLTDGFGCVQKRLLILVVRVKNCILNHEVSIYKYIVRGRGGKNLLIRNMVSN